MSKRADLNRELEISNAPTGMLVPPTSQQQCSHTHNQTEPMENNDGNVEPSSRQKTKGIYQTKPPPYSITNDNLPIAKRTNMENEEDLAIKAIKTGPSSHQRIQVSTLTLRLMSLFEQRKLTMETRERLAITAAKLWIFLPIQESVGQMKQSLLPTRFRYLYIPEIQPLFDNLSQTRQQLSQSPLRGATTVIQTWISCSNIYSITASIQREVLGVYGNQMYMHGIEKCSEIYKSECKFLTDFKSCMEKSRAEQNGQERYKTAKANVATRLLQIANWKEEALQLLLQNQKDFTKQVMYNPTNQKLMSDDDLQSYLHNQLASSEDSIEAYTTDLTTIMDVSEEDSADVEQAKELVKQIITEEMETTTEYKPDPITTYFRIYPVEIDYAAAVSHGKQTGLPKIARQDNTVDKDATQGQVIESYKTALEDVFGGLNVEDKAIAWPSTSITTDQINQAKANTPLGYSDKWKSAEQIDDINRLTITDRTTYASHWILLHNYVLDDILTSDEKKAETFIRAEYVIKDIEHILSQIGVLDASHQTTNVHMKLDRQFMLKNVMKMFLRRGEDEKGQKTLVVKLLTWHLFGVAGVCDFRKPQLCYSPPLQWVRSASRRARYDIVFQCVPEPIQPNRLMSNEFDDGYPLLAIVRGIPSGETAWSHTQACLIEVMKKLKQKDIHEVIGILGRVPHNDMSNKHNKPTWKHGTLDRTEHVKETVIRILWTDTTDESEVNFYTARMALDLHDENSPPSPLMMNTGEFQLECLVSFEHCRNQPGRIPQRKVFYSSIGMFGPKVYTPEIVWHLIQSTSNLANLATAYAIRIQPGHVVNRKYKGTSLLIVWMETIKTINITPPPAIGHNKEICSLSMHKYGPLQWTARTRINGYTSTLIYEAKYIAATDNEAEDFGYEDLEEAGSESSAINSEDVDVGDLHE